MEGLYFRCDGAQGYVKSHTTAIYYFSVSRHLIKDLAASGPIHQSKLA